MESKTPPLTCSVVQQLIREWAKTRDTPFPYREIGDHLTQCLACLTWTTEIAYRPTDHYLRALRLRLSEVLVYLGRSMLSVWSPQPDVKINFHVKPDELPEARTKVLKFLTRYESFSQATRKEGEGIRDVVAHATPESLLVALEPYEFIRYFFQAALGISPEDKRLFLLVWLGITESLQAMNERRAGHPAGSADHYRQAREHLARVIEAAPALTSGDAEGFDRSALVAARINLAGIEVMENDHSELSLHRAIDLLYEASRLSVELGFEDNSFPGIHHNLLICYLRLFLDHGVRTAKEQARRVAQEICASRELAAGFLKHYVAGSQDPELTRLLERPDVCDLAGFLKQQAAAQKPSRPSRTRPNPRD